MRLFTAILAAALIAILTATGPARAADYQLAPQDRLALRVAQWSPTQQNYVRLDAVSGEYTINADGMVSIPLIGTVKAGGETIAALSEVLTTRLRRQVGLSELPEIGLEVVGHQPVYVLGDVASPGAFPYRPGVTARQALALAGGFLRPGATTAAGAFSDALRHEGEIRTLTAELASLQSNRERILADLQSLAAQNGTAATAKAGAASATASVTPAAAPMQPIDTKILAARQTSRQAQSARIRELQTVLRGQIDKLNEQIALRRAQVDEHKKELKGFADLKDRGIIANTRYVALSSTVNDLEAKRLQLEIAWLTAQQQLNAAERDEATLFDDARSQDLTQLAQVEQDIAAAQIRLQTVKQLHAQAVAAGLAAPLADQEYVTKYQVTRSQDGATKSFDAAPGEALRPGDLVTITHVEVASQVSN